MLNNRIISAWFFLIALCITSLGHLCYAQQQDDVIESYTSAESFIDAKAAEISSIVFNNTTSDAHSILKNLFFESVDSKWIENVVLKKYTKNIPKSDLARLHKAFQSYIYHFYVQKFLEFKNYTYKVVGSSQKSNGYSLVTMKVCINSSGSSVEISSEDIENKSKLSNSAKAPINIKYLVKKKGNRYFIRDVMVEGVSSVKAQHQEFGSIIRNQGVESFIEMLESKTQKYIAELS